MEELVNIHTHVPGEGINVLNAKPGDICSERKNMYYSMGIHPVFPGDDPERDLQRIEELARSGVLVAIGEAGLDRNSAVGLEEQMNWFRRQIEIAESCRIPLIIHCVRVYPELLTLYKHYRPEQSWIVHGYNNNRQILSELLRHGLCISAGKKLFAEESNIAVLLPEIPLEQLFVETDDSAHRIGEVYGKVADILGIEPDVLTGQVYDNWKRCFNK